MRLNQLSTPALFAALILPGLPAAEAPAVSLSVAGGSVKFMASTNVSAVSVHGQSNEVSGRAILHRANAGHWLENLEAKVDPKSLNTGMAIRDQHMRNKIFAAGDALPPLRFVATRSDCPAAGKEATCQLTGELSLRGVTKPWTIAMKVRPDSAGYKAVGEGTVKLSAFSIEAPCQLGVCINDDVKLKLELQIREVHEASELRPAGGAK